MRTVRIHLAGPPLLFAWLLVLPSRAHCSEPDGEVELKWVRSVTAESCPGQDELERLVKARLGRDPFALGAPRTIEASIDYVDQSWHVQLHVRDRSGQEQGQRVFDVRAANCEPVTDAVGLAVALAIDPNASLAISPGEPVSSASPSEAQPRDAGGPPKSEAASVKPAPYPYAQLLAPIQVPCVPAITWQAELSARALAAGGLLPGIAPGIGVAGYFGRNQAHLLVGISYFAEAALDPRFSFGLTTADVGYCHDVAQSWVTVASACASVHAGAQHSVVRNAQPVHPGDRFFAAASIGPRFGWRAWAPLYLEAGAEAWVPFVRPEFAFIGQETAVFESHAIAASGYLGVGFTTK